MSKEGQIVEPIAEGIWRWPFGSMELGDYFLVHQEQKPIGAMRAYAAAEGKRRGLKFSVSVEGDYAKVTRVDPAETVGDRQAQKVEFEGGDGDKYLGVLRSQNERWAWPFQRMEPGEYFHVAHEDRHPERVRAFAMLRGQQLGIPLSVTANDPTFAGHAKIEFVEGGARIKGEQSQVIGFGLACEIIDRCYEVEKASMMEAWSVRLGYSRFYEAEQVEEPKRTIYEVSEPENEVEEGARWVLELEPAGLRISHLAKRDTLEGFTKRQLADIMA